MRTRNPVLVLTIAGALLLGILAIMTATIIMDAAHSHRTAQRLSSLEHRLSQLTDVRATLWSVQRIRNEIIETGRTGFLGEFDERLSSAITLSEALRESDEYSDAGNPFLDRGDETTAMNLQKMREFSTALSAKSDPRSVALFVIEAGRDPRYSLVDALKFNALAIDKTQGEMHRFAVEAFQEGEASAFWWLLIGGNTMMAVIIAAAGLFIFVENERRSAVAAQADAIMRTSMAEISRSRFLAAASHDLRQPLHAVMLFVTVLRRRVGDAYVTSLIDGVASAVTSLERMFNGLLDISKLDAGIVAAERKDFAVMHLVRNLEAEFVPLAQSKGLVFRGFCDETIIHTDPILLESMVRNIVANAIKYTPEGHVTVTCRPDGRFMVIEISDTGAGIADAEREDIFKEFYRSASSSDDVEGLGLGLSIVRRLSILLNVSVSVQSLVGVGSTFFLRVPISGGAPPAALMPTVRAPRTVATELHILLVDDNRLLREAISAELRDGGIKVTAMRSADEVIAFLSVPDNQTVFDGAIIDFSLGDGSNGVQLLDRVAAQFGIALPALIMTGETAPEILEELGDSGYTWLQKPVDTNVLISALARLIAASDNQGPTDLLSALERFTPHSGSAAGVAISLQDAGRGGG